ncbi:putative Flp pilus-assembly TadE/G-like protein [Roseinatronobacter thiooxidans]|uniref:Putative Flp pilus-assembly TadE/G-like protein n=1 Tax=Roseinatronobacter thiooxidans TaxID=121821 RepID=A0A2W7PX58_9RHOB|nr:pilus assembly protein TadG-related protein [Roseinatronobacter thiooxidans]PZX40691.1 putative Flp pilus-assembly TadE/G-like protein [Roseinatronobacter thiooxidans]
MLHHHLFRTDHAKAFAAGEQASVAVSSALVLPALLGIAGLAIEYGDALVTRAETQRVADLAAHAGIVACGRSAATNHDIAGHFDLSGGVTFGQGVYTIDGYLHLGAVAGGSVWCQDAMVSLRAIGVSFVLSGKGLHSNNQNCNGYAAFCASSGYDSMRLVAPSSGPYADIAVIGPLSPTVTAGATFSGGAFGSQISGAFYVPNGPILLTGGAGASSAGEGCFQLVGASVTLEGGTSTTSDCVSGNAGGGAQVRLIE